MKAIFVFLTFVAVGCAVPKYRSFEAINVNDYKNENRLNELINCITGTANCDRLDSEFKARGEDIVKTNCEDCRKKEKSITRDLITLIAKYDTHKLRTVLEVFDPQSRHSKSFLLWVQEVHSLANIPKIPNEVIDLFHDNDDDDNETEYDEDWHPRSRFVKRGGIVGGVRRLLRAILGVVGI